MPTCEKCWDMSYRPFANADESRLEVYNRLVAMENCTPEEQAGCCATVCPVCNRKAVHQYAKVCMACLEAKEDDE